jgi:cytochrome c-type biogenesis protein CcmE
MDKKNINPKLIAVITVVVIIVAGASFYGGMKYGQTKNRAGFAARGQMPGINNGSQKSGQNKNNGLVMGEIIAKDEKSITVQIGNRGLSAAEQASQTGQGTKIIFFSNATKVNMQTEGTTDDLRTGKQITANGTANTDGSITAQSINIRPDVLTQPTVPEAMPPQK